jgi:hypothetical protein
MPQGCVLGFDGAGREFVFELGFHNAQRSINARQEPQRGIKLGIFVSFD